MENPQFLPNSTLNHSAEHSDTQNATAWTMEESFQNDPSLNNSIKLTLLGKFTTKYLMLLANSSQFHLIDSSHLASGPWKKNLELYFPY